MKADCGRIKKCCKLITNSRNGCDDFSKLEFVKDGGFTSCIQSDHQYSHLLFAKETFEKCGEYVSHFETVGVLQLKKYKPVVQRQNSYIWLNLHSK